MEIGELASEIAAPRSVRLRFRRVQNPFSTLCQFN